jgi:hypothetical protein
MVVPPGEMAAPRRNVSPCRHLGGPLEINPESPTEPQKNTHRILVWKPERERPVAISRYRYEDNIKMDLKATCCVYDPVYL